MRYQPSRHYVTLTSILAVFFVGLISYTEGGTFFFSGDAVPLWIFFGIMIAAGASTAMLNWIETGPAEITVRKPWSSTTVPFAAISELSARSAGKQGAHVFIKYVTVGNVTKRVSFLSIYEKGDIAAMIEEIRNRNPQVQLDKNLTYFTAKVMEARQQGKSLFFVPLLKPLVDWETLAKYWWIFAIIVTVAAYVVRGTFSWSF